MHDQLPGAAPGAQPRPPSQTSQLATAAFVLGLLGFAVITAILAVVLGAVAVSRIRWSPRAGKALAIWGICLGAGWLVLLAVAIGIGAPVGFSFSSGTVSVPPGQPVPITSLVTGDCFDFPPAKGATFVDETPCNQPHNSQVFATFLASGSSSTYPGIASLTVLAARGCRARAGAVDGSKVSNSMSGRFMYPLADAWQAGGRTIKCVIYSPTSISSSVLTHQQQSRAQA